MASGIHLYGQKYVSEKPVSHPKNKLKTSIVYFDAINTEELSSKLLENIFKRFAD